MFFTTLARVRLSLIHIFGGVLGFDGGGYLIVAVGVVQVLHIDLDVGVLLVELSDEAVDVYKRQVFRAAFFSSSVVAAE